MTSGDRPLPAGPVTSMLVHAAGTCTRRASARVPSEQLAAQLRGGGPAGSSATGRRSARSPRRRTRCALTRSASCSSVGSAFATATPYSTSRSSAWSFSASPIATALRAESPSSASAAFRPLALLTEDGQHHHRALVEDDLQLEAEVADRLEHDRSRSGGPWRRSTRPPRAARRRGARARERTPTAAVRRAPARWPVPERRASAPFSATTRSNTLDPGKDREQLVELAPGDEHELAAARREPPQSGDRRRRRPCPSVAIVPS